MRKSTLGIAPQALRLRSLSRFRHDDVAPRETVRQGWAKAAEAVCFRHGLSPPLPTPSTDEIFLRGWTAWAKTEQARCSVGDVGAAFAHPSHAA
jgi:hypothetical protein